MPMSKLSLLSMGPTLQFILPGLDWKRFFNIYLQEQRFPQVFEESITSKIKTKIYQSTR